MLIFALLVTGAIFTVEGLAQERVVEHTQPVASGAKATLTFEITTQVPVTTALFLFQHQDFPKYQVRVMERTAPDKFTFALDTTTLLSRQLRYYFIVITGEKRHLYPAQAPEETLALELATTYPADIAMQTPPKEIQPETGPLDPGVETWPWQIDVNGSIRYEIDSDGPSDLFDESRRFAGDGNILLSKWHQIKAWQINFDADMRYNSVPLEDEEELSLSYLELVAENDHHLFGIGDLPVNGSRYTLDRFDLRGLQYTFTMPWMEFQLFNINTQEQDDFDRIIPHSDAGLYGFMAGLRTPDERYSLAVRHIDGRDDPNEASNVAGTDLAKTEGDVWSVAPTVKLADERLTITGEFAEGEFDDDPSDDEDAISDQAWYILSEYTRENWNIGAEYLHVGTHFDTVANQNGITFTKDRQGFNLFGEFTVGKITTDLKYEYLVDNLDDDPKLPFSDYHDLAGNINYLASDQLSFTLGLHQGVQDSYEEEAKSTLIQDATTTDVSIGAGWFISNNASLQVSAIGSQLRSDIDPEAESDTWTANLSGFYQYKERFTIFPGVGLSSTKMCFNGLKTDTFNGFVVAEYFAIPERLSFSTTSAYVDTTVEDGDNSQETSLDGRINFHLGWINNWFENQVLALVGEYEQTKTGAQSEETHNVRAQLEFAF